MSLTLPVPPLTHVPKCQGHDSHEGVMRAGPGTFTELNLIELPWPINPDCPDYSAEPSSPLADQHSSPTWCYLWTYWKRTLLPRLVGSDDSRGPGQPVILWLYDPPIQITDEDVNDLDDGNECTMVMGGFQLNKCDDGCCEIGSVWRTHYLDEMFFIYEQ